MSFLEDLAAQRQKFVDGLEANRDDINLNIFDDFYPDQAHFIFELLQNAEDTGATIVSFTLTNDQCAFEHNGERQFNEDDVKKITGCHNSTKTSKPDKIGKFGIGFKSVFAYTEAPVIYSRDFSFQILERVLPVAVSNNHNLGGWTRFEFPFNNSSRPADIAYRDIKAGLERLPDTTLLFLFHLKSIRWHIGSESSGAIHRISHPENENYIELLKEVNKKTVERKHFLRFSEPVKNPAEDVEGQAKPNVSIAFVLDFLPKVSEFDPEHQIAEQMKIVPTTTGQVAVYFPAVKETSGLRFHLHAPFVPELSRASIKDSPLNEPLFGQLAQLAATSLYTIRDLGLLTGEFLAVLPNPHDSLPRQYQPIRNAIINEMQNQPLTPTLSISHAPAKHLLQAQPSLKELLPNEDIQRLLNHNGRPPQWAINATQQKDNNQDHFLTGLGIFDYKVRRFVEHLSLENFQKWLSNKPVEWHQRMYALLYDYHNGLWRNEERDPIKKLPIVRLSDGSYSTGDKCYFPSAGVDSDPEFPRVDQRVYSSGKNEKEQADARKLLETIGVREVGEADQVQSILRQRYTSEALRPELNDLERFVRLVEDDPTNAGVFNDYFIFKLADNKRWGKPSAVFLDSPYLDTGLTSYHDALGSLSNSGQRKWALSDQYSQDSVSRERLVRFAQTVGVQTRLPVERRSTENHRCINTLRADYSKKRVRWTGTVIDEDWMISNLELLLDKRSEALARLVWQTLCGADRKVLKARFRPNQCYLEREEPSSLVLLLQETPWVPQNNGKFVRPLEASRASLPKGFPVDEGYEWLKAVRFGENERHQSEADRQRQVAGRQRQVAAWEHFGISDDDSERRVRQFMSWSPEEQRRILKDDERKPIARLEDSSKYGQPQKHNQGKEKDDDTAGFSFLDELNKAFNRDGETHFDPDASDYTGGIVKNPAGVGEKLKKEHQDAKNNEPSPEERHHKTERSLLEGPNEAVRVSLYEWYHGKCQICGETWPERDGSPYFTAAYLVERRHARLVDTPGNAICLCAKHFAQWRHAVIGMLENVADQIRSLRLAAEGGDGKLTIRFRMLEDEQTITYNERHLLELRELLEVASEAGR